MFELQINILKLGSFYIVSTGSDDNNAYLAKGIETPRACVYVFYRKLSVYNYEDE